VSREEDPLPEQALRAMAKAVSPAIRITRAAECAELNLEPGDEANIDL
jgi:hypothetical protein